MKNNFRLAFIIMFVVSCYIPLYGYTIDEPHYDAGMKFNRVNCENDVWDYIWFDGDTFYIDDSMGGRQIFETLEAAAEYVCGEEESGQ